MQYAIIMAGGSGRRLWPLSRRNRPKQIIDLLDAQSLLQRCVARLQGLLPLQRIFVVTNAEYEDLVHRHLPELPVENILGEPIGRDTANAIGLAASILLPRDPQAVLAVFSADQVIEPLEPLQQAVRQALAFIDEHPEALFTFGIKAAYAHTGLGYLKRGQPASGHPGIFAVEAFREKPNKSTAHKYIRSGNYCWNSGIFVWRADTILRQLELFLPHNADRLLRIGQAWPTDRRPAVLKKEFDLLQKISIDFAVLEHAQHVYMCEIDCHWVDIGSYETLAENVGRADADNNVTTPATRCEWLDSSNNLVISTCPDHLIAAIHVEDLIIVHTQDTTLICRKEETGQLKPLLDRMAVDGNERYL